MREAEIATSLKPVTDLLEDSSYWRLQSRSLIVFVAAGFFQAVRLPIELAESLSIDEDFNILPLASCARRATASSTFSCWPRTPCGSSIPHATS